MIEMPTDYSDVKWKSWDWSHDTVEMALLQGGGVMWYDPDTEEWYLDPAGSVPESLR